MPIVEKDLTNVKPISKKVVKNRLKIRKKQCFLKSIIKMIKLDFLFVQNYKKVASENIIF